MTRITIAPGRSGISLPVTLQHIAEVLVNSPDAGLPAYESITLELNQDGSVTVTRQDGERLHYQHPRARAAAARQQDPAQLKLFDARTA